MGVLQRDEAGMCAVDFAVLEDKSEMLEIIMKFEEEEDRIRNEKVAQELAQLAKEDSSSVGGASSDDSGLTDDDPQDGNKETRAERQKRIDAGDTRRSSKAPTTPRRRSAMRSAHLLPPALRKAGLNVDPP